MDLPIFLQLPDLYEYLNEQLLGLSARAKSIDWKRLGIYEWYS